MENPGKDDLYQMGTVGMIMRQLKLPDGRLKVLIQGVTRGRITRKMVTQKSNTVRTTGRKIRRGRILESSVIRIWSMWHPDIVLERIWQVPPNLQSGSNISENAGSVKQA